MTSPCTVYCNNSAPTTAAILVIDAVTSVTSGVIRQLTTEVDRTTSCGEVFDKNCTIVSGSSSSLAVSATSCASFRFIFNSILIGFLCVIGLVGNTVSMAVLRRDRNNRVAVFLLKALSVADSVTLVISFVVLTVFYGALHESNPRALMAARPYIIRFVNPLGYMAQSVTVWMTVLLGVNRYMAICRPFYAGRMLGITGAQIQVGGGQLLSVDRDD